MRGEINAMVKFRNIVLPQLVSQLTEITYADGVQLSEAEITSTEIVFDVYQVSTL